MAFQGDPGTIQWRLHLGSPPEEVFQALATDQGRAAFWAESAVQEDGHIRFKFPNGMEWKGRILSEAPPRIFELAYFGSNVRFELEPDGQGGTDLTLSDSGFPVEDRMEVCAGWVSVLMALKAAVDFGIDLRSHDRERTWSQGYCEN